MVWWLTQKVHSNSLATCGARPSSMPQPFVSGGTRPLVLQQKSCRGVSLLGELSGDITVHVCAPNPCHLCSRRFMTKGLYTGVGATVVARQRAAHKSRQHTTLRVTHLMPPITHTAWATAPSRSPPMAWPASGPSGTRLGGIAATPAGTHVHGQLQLLYLHARAHHCVSHVRWGLAALQVHLHLFGC